MQTPDTIESRLHQLMPVAFSEAGRDALESLLDDLAGASASAEPAPALASASSTRQANHGPAWWLSRGAAAACAGCLVAWSFLAGDRPSAPPLTQNTRTLTTQAASPAGMVLVGQSDVVSSMVDEGWMDDPDGVEMHAVRLQILTENHLRDEETGIVMRISQPREEMLLMPVTAF